MRSSFQSRWARGCIVRMRGALLAPPFSRVAAFLRIGRRDMQKKTEKDSTPAAVHHKPGVRMCVNQPQAWRVPGLPAKACVPCVSIKL
jgi:hypothetical protein